MANNLAINVSEQSADIRFYTLDDYPLFCAWLKRWKFPVLPKEMLPEIGFVVEREGAPVGMCFVYQSDSALCMLEWLTTSPDIPRDERHEIIDIMIKKAQAFVKEIGRLGMFTAVRHPTLIKKLPQHGFISGDSEMHHFFWRAV